MNLPPKISFCTTCMGRLHHLRETYLRNLAVAHDPERFEFVLLDYNSADGLEDWAKTELAPFLKTGLVKFYRTSRPSCYLSPHSKNVAHKLAQGAIVSNLDADNFITEPYVRFLQRAFETMDFRLTVSFDGPGIGSRISLFKSEFIKVGGYDERMSFGWGYDDTEFIIRLQNLGYIRITNMAHRLFGAALEHGNIERNNLMPNKVDIWETGLKNFEAVRKSGARTPANQGKSWGSEVVVKNFGEAVIET